MSDNRSTDHTAFEIQTLDGMRIVKYENGGLDLYKRPGITRTVTERCATCDWRPT